MITGTEKYLYQLIEKSAVIIELIKNWREKFYSRCNFVKRSVKSV